MDLKKRYGHKYEIAMDPSWDAETPENRTEFLAKGEQWWYYELRGQRGMIYPFNASTLAVYVTPRQARRLERRLGPALTVHVRCDEAVVYKADVRYVEALVRFIKPKRLRPLSETHKAALSARLAAHRYKGSAAGLTNSEIVNGARLEVRAGRPKGDSVGQDAYPAIAPQAQTTHHEG